MKRLSWKYLAGLMDGEGCLKYSIRRKTNTDGTYAYYPQIGYELTLTESSKHVIDMLHHNHGGRVYYREYDNPNWKPTYCWRLYNKKDVRALSQNLFKHCYIKNEQMKLAIWMIDNLKGKQDEEIVYALKKEFKLQKGDPQRLSEEAVKEILSLMR